MINSKNYDQKKDALRKWIDSLNQDQTKKALEIAVWRLMETEELNIRDDDIARGPYWDSCGEGILYEGE